MNNSKRYRALAAAMMLAAGTHAFAGDCYNDEHPQSNDLEPPPPGSRAELLRITDNDVARVLDQIRAYEARHAGADATVAKGPTRDDPKR